MYGADWCTHCEDQKKLFGDAFARINYVACAETNETPQIDLCEQNGIEVYPTWVINGQSFRGVQSLADLGKASGCTI